MYDYFKFFSVPCYRIQCDVIDLKLQEINSLLCPLMKNWLNEPVFSSSSRRFCSAFIKILIIGEKYINRYLIFCKMINIHFTNLYTRDTCQLFFLPIIFLFSNGRGEKESDIASLQLSQQYFKAELECVCVCGLDTTLVGSFVLFFRDGNGPLGTEMRFWWEREGKKSVCALIYWRSKSYRIAHVGKG